MAGIEQFGMEIVKSRLQVCNPGSRKLVGGALFRQDREPGYMHSGCVSKGYTRISCPAAQWQRLVQTLAYELRLSAVETLISSIGDDLALVELKTDVEAFYALIVAARDNQQGKEGLVDGLSVELEQERVN